MSLLSRNLNIRNIPDRTELFRTLTSAGFEVPDVVLDYAIEQLTDDWLELKTLDLVSLQIGRASNHAIDLFTWAKVLQLLYEVRDHEYIEEQFRRLRLRSHEKLDTILVILVAGRYHERGFEIAFEPNISASTDLIVCRNPNRLYLEIKRENLQEHKRHQRMLHLGSSISDRAARGLKDWLTEKRLRIEIKLSRLFSDSHVDNVVQEVERKAKSSLGSTEERLSSVPGSAMIVLPSETPFFYAKGIHSAVVRVEKAGEPVQLFAPASMPVRCTFEAHPNLQALGNRIGQAGKQLKRDLDRDLNADGFVVMELAFGGDVACKAIETRFWSRLPIRCWGVTLISRPGFVIPRSDLSNDQIEVMKIAAPDGKI